MNFNSEVQEAVLKELLEEMVPATIFLMNGFQIRGIVRKYDDVSIAFETDGKQQLLFKHAISTIAPIRPLRCLERR